MDYGEMGIILAVIGIGLAIIGLLGNNKLNKLSTQIDNKFNKLSTQIEGVEIRLEGEFSRINSEINLLRQENAMKIEGLNNSINYRIKRLEDIMYSGRESPAFRAKKGRTARDK